MAFQYPASLPHLGLNLGVGSALGQVGNPGPLPHLAILGGLGGNARRLFADFGSYALNGQANNFLYGRVMPASRGTFGVVGQPGILSKTFPSMGEAIFLPSLSTLFKPVTTSRTLIADTGIYSITGSDSIADFETFGAGGTYSIAGQAASLFKGYRVAANFGLFDITGQDAGSIRGGVGQKLTADFGTFNITGQSANLVPAYRLSANQGFYSFSGPETNFIVGVSPNKILPADSGLFSVFGQSAQFFARTRADTGAYSIQGFPAEMVKASPSFVVTLSGVSFSYTIGNVDMQNTAPGKIKMYIWQRVA